MGIENKGPGNVGNSYGQRSTIKPIKINSTNPKDVYNEFDDGLTQSLTSGGINLLNIWTPDAAIQSASDVMREIKDAHASVKADWVPTHFCDPSATVDGSGTYSSPYQVSQLAAIFTGRKKSVTLGMKRGGVYRGTVSLGQNGVSGVGGDALDGEYFQIVPYGDHPRLPMFIASQNRKDWVDIGNGVYAITLSGFANQGVAERDVFQNYMRLLRVTSLTALQASSGGTQFNSYSGGVLTIYIKPYAGENPNLGQIEVGSNDVGFRLVIHADSTRTGGVQVHGLHIEGSRNSALLVVSNAAASGVVVNQCVTGNTGVDNNNGLGMDGIIVNGFTDAARMQRLAVTNNYAFNVRNNAVEVSYADGAVVESNKSRNVGGASIIECWNSVSNIKVRFNSGIGDPDNSYRQTLGAFANCGFWSAGQTDGDVVDAGGTKNVNNEFTFNYVQDSARCWKMVSGTGHKIHHNTHYIKSPNGKPGASNFEGGVTQGSNTLTINHTNNLYLSNNTSEGYQFMNLTAAAHVAGNNNYYMSPLGSCSLRVAGSTKFALEDWVTAMGGAVDTASKVGPGLTSVPATWSVAYNSVMVDHSGRPVSNSALRGKGLSGLVSVENGVSLPYIRDNEGKPMSTSLPTVGCFA